MIGSAGYPDSAAAVAGRTEAGVHHELGLQGDVGPRMVRFAAEYEFAEAAGHVRLLCILPTVTRLGRGVPGRVRLHVEAAALHAEVRPLDRERRLRAVVRQHEVLDRHGPLVATDVRPLLQLGAERAVERPADA